jgi:hypothetical protein
MKRLLAIGLVSFLAWGCASAPRSARLAVVAPSQALQELECMGDCLDEADASCEDCAAQCFSPPTGVLLTLTR